MKTTVRKFFFAWDFDKEEKWLNDMAAQGKALTGVGFCKYTFEDCEPGEYTVRLELLENHTAHEKSVQYLDFLRETGAEYVGNYFRWVYLRKRCSNGEFELYSDNASRVKHLNRIIALLLPISAANVAIGLSANSLVNLAIGALGLYGTLRLHKKRKRIESDAQLYE